MPAEEMADEEAIRATGVSIGSTPPMRTENAQVNLRFVNRGGRFILQQLWVIGEFRSGMLIPISQEWRDVPVAERE